MSETTYIKKLSELEDIPAPDDLLAGSHKVFAISITGTGKMTRGTLMQSDGLNVFKKAQTGFESAKELCILAEDIDFEDSESAVSIGYFDSELNASRIVLPEGTVIDDEVIASLRQHGLYVR